VKAIELLSNKMENIIELQKVWKTYLLGKIKLDVLRGVSLEIKKQDFALILGPSGSGKSTLLNMVSCLDVPTSGKVILEKKDVSKLSEDELAEVRGKKIGFVFQQFNLLTHLTAIENVVLPTVFQGVLKEEREERAKELLTSVGLQKRMNHRPAELSGGERQRVAIARSLVNNPEIIVADEPTGNVDSKTGGVIMDILKELNKKGRTIIVVTHDADLKRFANRVIKIKDGEIDDK
jgi:putative ABC transport system ATP-binding protein